MELFLKTTLVAGLAILIASLVFIASLVRNDQKRVEYYRGVYDVCTGISTDPAKCAGTIERFSRSGWYEKDSPGWDPSFVLDRVPTPTSTPRPTRMPELTATDQ